MNDLIRLSDVHLPAVPIVLPPHEGQNLEASALILTHGAKSAEQVIVDFRNRYSPESQRWFRRYYLKAHRNRDRTSLRYAWNLDIPSTDRTVGIFKGDDLAAAQILIGNNMAGAWMSSISWHLCEDRDGDEPVAIGRFDPWSLLQDITPADIVRLRDARGLVPNIEGWDFDNFYMHRKCPSCGQKISINMFAFNIDSAQCNKCGVRPFLSCALGRLLHLALPAVTGQGEQILSADQALLNTVEWLGDVNAGTDHLHQEELPEHITPHLMLEGLLKNSRLLAAAPEGRFALAPTVMNHLADNQDSASMVIGAANLLAKTIQEGGPFTDTHAATARLLQLVERDALKALKELN
ncbi:hypothetical protein HQ571_06895 [Candidatus Kuenenbacteria bacterium]|nr:hypothetical protein [Candidatus Kuenenbacteria bacterium]